jgi:hypothetical protein
VVTVEDLAAANSVVGACDLTRRKALCDQTDRDELFVFCRAGAVAASFSRRTKPGARSHTSTLRVLRSIRLCAIALSTVFEYPDAKSTPVLVRYVRRALCCIEQTLMPLLMRLKQRVGGGM